jgi:hypothetical protein
MCTLSSLKPMQPLSLTTGFCGVLTTAVAIVLPMPGAFAGALENHPARRVVARSTEQTAATGRQPLSARLTLARQAVQFHEADRDHMSGAGEEVPPVEDPYLSERQATHAGPSPAATESEVVNSEQAGDDRDGVGDGRFAELQSSGGFFYPPSITAGLPVQAASESPHTPPRMNAGPRSRSDNPSMAAIAIDVRESQPKAPQGAVVEWCLRLCNTGSEPANDVSAVLFFAEGIEPVAASGSRAALAAGEVRFAPLAQLAAGETVELQVTGICVSPGHIAYRAEVAFSEDAQLTAHDGMVQVTEAVRSE